MWTHIDLTQTLLSQGYVGRFMSKHYNTHVYKFGSANPVKKFQGLSSPIEALYQYAVWIKATSVAVAHFTAKRIATG